MQISDSIRRNWTVNLVGARSYFQTFHELSSDSGTHACTQSRMAAMPTLDAMCALKELQYSSSLICLAVGFLLLKKLSVQILIR